MISPYEERDEMTEDKETLDDACRALDEISDYNYELKYKITTLKRDLAIHKLALELIQSDISDGTVASLDTIDFNVNNYIERATAEIDKEKSDEK